MYLSAHSIKDANFSCFGPYKDAKGAIFIGSMQREQKRIGFGRVVS